MMESILGMSIGLLLSHFSIGLSKWRGRLDLFAPPMVVLVTMWLQYYLPAFTLPYYDYWVYPHRWEKNQVVLYPVLMSSVAWLAFLFGYGVRLGRSLSRSLSVPIPSRYTVWTAWALILVGLGSLLIAVWRSGGFLQIAQLGSVAEGAGVWVHLGFLTLPGIALLWSCGRSRVIAALVAMTYFAILMAAQGRGAALEVFILLFIMIGYLQNLTNTTLLALGGVFVLFAITVGSVGRVLMQVKSLSDVVTLTIKVTTDFVYNTVLTINRDLSRLEQLSIIMELVPERVGYFLGIPMLQGLFGPFRKYLFPGSIDWRVVLTATAMFGSAQDLRWGMGGTGVGEWYANFGFVGVVVGWIFLGVGARCLYEWFQLNRKIYTDRVIVPLYVLLLLIFAGCVGETITHLFSMWLLLPVVMTSLWKRPHTATVVSQLNHGIVAVPRPGGVFSPNSSLGPDKDKS